MKKGILALVAALSAVIACRGEVDASQLAELALKDAVGDAAASLAAAAKIPAKEPVAVLPFDDAGAGVVGLLKNALVAAGKTCVEGKEDPAWDEILKEIAWDERKEDILDPATLDKFGRIKSARYLMYGSIRRVASGERSLLVELELHVSCISTKEHVWGGTFVRRHFAPGAEPDGALDIPAEVRLALVDGIRGKVAASLAKSGKLGSVSRVAMLPISGDVDQYAEGLFRDVLAKSSVTPVNLDVATRAEARFALREGGGKADAIAYGVLRDLSARVVETQPTGEKTCAATMELQLWIERAATREIVWSDTVQFAKEFETGARGWWNRLCTVVPFFADHPSAVVWLPLAVLLGLVVLFKFLKATTRVR